MVWFLLGLFVGNFCGVILCAAVVAAGRADRKEIDENDWE